MKKTFADLTEEERTAFSDAFYAIWTRELHAKDDLDNGNNPAPWGCPWDWCGEDEAVSPEDFFRANRAEIANLVKEGAE